MKICFFGIYDPNYSRNRVLMSGLRQNGHTVVECRADPKTHRWFNKYQKLWSEYKKIDKASIDFVIVGFPGHTIVWFAYILFQRKKIVFDAFLSLYDSNVFDRKNYSVWSMRAIVDWLLDWHACVLVPHVLIDTNQHIEYFAQTFHLSRNKYIRVPIGVDETNFQLRRGLQKGTQKIIHFHGTFIPLQGIEVIIKAAEIARYEPWIFRIGGNGQEFKHIKNFVKEKDLKNVELIGLMPYEKVPEYIANADICLGIFGPTEKTLRVIPNKVYECIAMQKPIITADTPAMREFFTDGEDILFCRVDNPESLYQALKKMFATSELAERIAHGGYELFLTQFTSRTIVANMLKSLPYEK